VISRHARKIAYYDFLSTLLTTLAQGEAVFGPETISQIPYVRATNPETGRLYNWLREAQQAQFNRDVKMQLINDTSNEGGE
jgi:hypothetical protein